MATLADVLRQTGYSQDGTLGTPTPVESPMTKALAEHIKSIPQKFEENQAHQMDLLARAYPGNTFKSNMLEGDPAAMAELAMQAPVVGMMAYHGTPHKILGKFDISKIGTGEGAQAYGHGMYFAENPAVATEYKNMLGSKIDVNGKPLYNANKTIGSTGNTELDDYLVANLGDVKATRKQLLNDIKEIRPTNPEAAKEMQTTLADLRKANVGVQNTGNLYKVDIPDEHIPNMLDWDKPINQQSKVVQDALSQIGITGKMTGKELYKFMPEQMQAETLNFSKKPSDADVSKYLDSLGIKGIRYLDSGSRGKSGTSNFVVFDPSTVKILEENGKQLSRKELIEQQLSALEDTGRAKAGGQLADANGYFYKGGQFLPTTTAEPGKWKINGKWVKSGKELIEPGVIANAPTPFSRSILSPLREYVDYVDNDFKKLKLKEGRKVLENVDGMQTYVPVTNETTWTPRLADYEHHTPVTIGELIEAYNKGQRWFDVKPDAVTITTK